MKKVTVYTDGACSGNPGPGGWCAILIYNGTEKVLSGGKKLTTNNEMELTAVVQALGALKDNALLMQEIFTSFDGEDDPPESDDSADKWGDDQWRD